MAEHYLKKLFMPSSVAVFGANERANSVGGIVYNNILQGGFKGEVYPINPKYQELLGRRCYPSLEALNKPVDLMVVATPAATIPAIMDSAGRHGIPTAVVLSAGFSETGEEGRKLERAVVENARHYGIRFIGPNCLGIMRPDAGLNTTFNKGLAKPGNLALLSQSGAICTAIMDWAAGQNIGFSTVISMGVSADIDFGEALDFLIQDPQTDSILLYIEGIKNARTFMSGLRAAARVKPVIAVKAGRHQAGSRAALSHTGALVGADDVFDAALRRAGVVRGMHIGDLFAAATVLTGPSRARGDRLAIITNGGGPGAMASDRASDLDIPLAEFSSATLAKMNERMPPMWSKANPADIIGDASPERYEAAVRICLADENVDGALVILTPQAMTEPTVVAEKVIAAASSSKKPIVTCWMGDAQVREGRARFAAAGIPTYRLPETAIQGFGYLASFYHNQKLLLQTPGPQSQNKPPDVSGARMIIENALAEKRKVLTELESKAILAAFNIPVTRATLARSAGEALVQAESIGFPVVMKIYSKDITHKSDVGGVRLGLSNARAVQAAYNEMVNSVQKKMPQAKIEGVVVEAMHSSPHGRELLVGIIGDSVFGPVITFGSGGTAVEYLGDRAVTLPPLNSLLVRDLIQQTRAAKLLQPFRNMPAADINAVEQVLFQVSEMACELPWIREMDINPLIVDERGAMAVDARIVVEHHSKAQRRYSHMAIHPYPVHCVTHGELPGGIDLTIRPVRPEDAEIEKAFVRNLSEQSRYYRFMHNLPELTPEMLVRFTQIDYDREMAFVAIVRKDDREIEIGVSRYTIETDGRTCEFAVVVADAWRQHGVAHKLMEQLIEYARYQRLETMHGLVLAENREMIALARSLDFSVHPNPEDHSLVSIVKNLK